MFRMYGSARMAPGPLIFELNRRKHSHLYGIVGCSPTSNSMYALVDDFVVFVLVEPDRFRDEASVDLLVFGGRFKTRRRDRDPWSAGLNAAYIVWMTEGLSET